MDEEIMTKYLKFIKAEMDKSQLGTQFTDELPMPYREYGRLVDCNEDAVDSDQMLQRMARAVVRTLAHIDSSIPLAEVTIKPDRDRADGFYEFGMKISS